MTPSDEKKMLFKPAKPSRFARELQSAHKNRAETKKFDALKMLTTFTSKCLQQINT
jgi:hypothetical protein